MWSKFPPRTEAFKQLFYGTVNQLLINLVPFTVMIFTKTS